MSGKYFFGLIVVALAIGFEYTSFHGWMVLGGGYMLYAIIRGMLNYLNGTNRHTILHSDKSRS